VNDRQPFLFRGISSLKPGDVTAITISSIGTLTNTFVMP